ncbi:MAG: SDR family NAD(P)-dependent oxidoreductase [Acidobacteriota bacterium]
MIDSEPEQPQLTDVAVIGMACRFPGAENPRQFWSLLREGREALLTLTDEELRQSGVTQSLLEDPDYVKAGMFLQKMEQFDPGFFGFSPLDATILDPQHRHFLECTWEALEDAGYDPARFDGSIGVFAGSGHNAYLPYNLLTNRQLVADVGLFLLRHTGNDKDFLTTRASYLFDLKGPSVNVQTACSTSLVAIHMAVQSLVNGECDMALAGGVTIELPHRQGYLYKEAEILSRDGHCRPFDASAGGTVFGSGVGVVMLKLLDQAFADGDHIHAVIKASAVNNDGAGKVSYLAPSVEGQAASIQEALLVGGIAPESVSYIETHGTGTQLGDPIEVEALTQEYASANRPARSCGIGSVKSNIGHLDTAAGVASMIKVILALKHRQLPASINYESPNPSIDLAAGPFYVNTRLRPWDGPFPRRAAVSSLGVGGTNAHVILEEPPQNHRPSDGRSAHLLLLSARTDSALSAGCARLAEHLNSDGNNDNLADVAYTLTTGRRHFRKRISFVVSERDEAVTILTGAAASAIPRPEVPDSERTVAFMFAGGGAQYPNMGRGLYESEEVFRAAVDECLELVERFIDFDAKSLLYPEDGAETEAAREMERPSRSLPLLFITQYAQAQLWKAWGVEPAAMIGHSMGENTAACLAGVLSLNDALGLVALRGRLFETLPAGGMLSVNASWEEVLPHLAGGLGIAARNAPGLTVVSGHLASIADLETTLLDRDVSFQRIRINVAAHSAMLEPILASFGNYLRTIDMRPPAIPFVSNLTGTWITPEQATDPQYWVRHLRETVRFDDGAGELLKNGQYALLEVGPGRTLATLVGMNGNRAPKVIASSLRHPEDRTPDLTHMLGALGQLWQGNVTPVWDRFFDGFRHRRISLPTYAFDHARYWVEPGKVTTSDDEERKPFDEWFHAPVWVPRPLPTPAVAGTVCVIGPEDVTSRLAPALSSGFSLVIEAVVQENAPFGAIGENRYRLGVENDYRSLVRVLAGMDGRPITFYVASPLSGEVSGNAAERQLRPLFHLARALSEEECDAASLVVLTRGAMRLPGESEPANVAGGCLPGATRVVASELGVAASIVDLAPDFSAREALFLARERPANGDTALVAYRSGTRFQAKFERVVLSQSRQPVIKDGNVYVITGGFGGIGLTVANHLAACGQVKLALLGRRLPEEGEPAGFFLSGGKRSALELRALEQLRASTAELMLLQADVSDRDSLSAALEAVQGRWGRIDGVFHAAGVLSEALLPLQREDELGLALAAKVDGTLHLFSHVAPRGPGFMILFSSTSALAGMPGQFAYAAANSFQDAFAEAKAGSEFSVTSVNWPAWQRVGMTARLADEPVPRTREIDRGARSLVEGSSFHYVVDGSDWIVDEHRTREGAMVLPGSGFIEIAAAAAEAVLPGEGAICLRDFVVLQPMTIASGERLVVSVTFDENGHFSIYSSGDADRARRGEWLAEHASGEAEKAGAAAQPTTRKLTKVQRTEVVDGGIAHEQMSFGPRWSCIRTIEYAEGEALLRLRLQDEFFQDLAEHPMHPALLDMATGAATGLIPHFDPKRDFYVPQSYGEVILHSPLVSEITSYVTRVENSSADACVLDIQITDAEERPLVEIKGFLLRRMATDTLNALGKATSVRAVDPSLQSLLEHGITPEEGMRVIDRLLASPGHSRILVAPFGKKKIFSRRSDYEQARAAASGSVEQHARPLVSSVYVPAATELEKNLAAIWQEGLGIEGVGMNDDFFELGGHSLLMIQLVNRARKRAGVNLPLAKLYACPTIAGWVQLATDSMSDGGSSHSRPALKRVSREAYRASENEN